MMHFVGAHAHEINELNDDFTALGGDADTFGSDMIFE